MSEKLTLLGSLGDSLEDSTNELVIVMRIPCKIVESPEDSEAVKEARSYFYGTEYPLLCTMDYRVIGFMKEILGDRIPTYGSKSISDEVHLSYSQVNHRRKTVILLGGLDTRAMIYENHKDEPREYKDIRDKFLDREEIPLLTLEGFAYIFVRDNQAFEKALGLGQ
jgi:hypothetical protein